MLLSDLAFLLQPVPTPDNGNSVIALYGMVAALGTAFLAGIFSVINKVVGSKVDASGPTASMKRVAKQGEAMERWLLLNHPDVDPRKIKTGYETLEEVRRASAS